MNHQPDLLRRDRHIEHALDHAQRLSEPRPRGERTPEWWAEASLAGDMTALAAVDLARSLRS